MCMSVHPSKMSNTKIYSGIGERNDSEVHVLAYQNTAISDKPNAMVLPISSKDELTEQNLIDTTTFTFLDDILAATQINYLGATRSYALNSSKPAQVFDKGSYTIIIADEINQVPNALEKVPEHKRPSVSEEFLQGFGNLYAGNQIIICCWQGSIKPEPILLWYNPLNLDTLFIPTMDAHSGKVPDLNDKVAVDHVIAVGFRQETKKAKQASNVNYRPYSNMSEEVRKLLPLYTYGKGFYNEMINGDMFVNTKELYGDVEPIISRGHKLSKINSVGNMNGWELRPDYGFFNSDFTKILDFKF